MKQKFRELPEAVNTNEAFLLGINERLDALLDAIDNLSKKEEQVVQEAVKVEEPVKVEVKPEPVKRTARKAPAKLKEE